MTLAFARFRIGGWLLASFLSLLYACASPRQELQGLAEQAPLDRAVLVTGGAFLVPSDGRAGTFLGDDRAVGTEVLAIDTLLDVLQRGRVFQRVVLDPDPQRRRRFRDQLATGSVGGDFAEVLAAARADGFDLLLVVEELRDGPIEQLGTNGRWPVTLATWVLLGVGALIPDRTFESRATLRVSVRDLQTGLVYYDPLLTAGPIELALTERTDWWGLLSSILVPPFWVGDDLAAVGDAVRATTARRLLLSLARDLKSEPVRQRLRARAPASLLLVRDGQGSKVTVDSVAGLSVVRLSAPGLAAGAATRFEQELLASLRRDGDHFHGEARLPPVPPGQLVQVSVGTLLGGVASATFAPGSAP